MEILWYFLILFKLSNATIKDRDNMLPVLDCSFQYTCVDITPICISFQEDMTNRKPKVLKIEDLCNLQYVQCAENVKAKLLKPKHCGLPNPEYDDSSDYNAFLYADYEIEMAQDRKKKCALA
ncbi:hypothetical protein MSG28_016223 [Choristoneura fumiferana]|uniref:Uncharacterized protein n=1 Tax=Choristoneura fumiferana TaxID=7141 RepID=A0ACC0K6C2_CHOFU|nr:hypothetical protein MSG28_016223 [Choristoneura fumiferana]